MQLALLAIIAHSAVQLCTRKLHTMLFCSLTAKKCLTQQSSFLIAKSYLAIIASIDIENRLFHYRTLDEPK